MDAIEHLAEHVWKHPRDMGAGMNTIYAGKAPIYRLGAHQFRLLEFALRYPGWHTVGRDRVARRALASLVKRRLVETAGDQFRFSDTRP